MRNGPRIDARSTSTNPAKSSRPHFSLPIFSRWTGPMPSSCRALQNWAWVTLGRPVHVTVGSQPSDEQVDHFMARVPGQRPGQVGREVFDCRGQGIGDGVSLAIRRERSRCSTISANGSPGPDQIGPKAVPKPRDCGLEDQVDRHHVPHLPRRPTPSVAPFGTPSATATVDSRQAGHNWIPIATSVLRLVGFHAFQCFSERRRFVAATAGPPTPPSSGWGGSVVALSWRSEHSWRGTPRLCALAAARRR